MKVPLRILLILVSIGILIYASLPPGESETAEAEPSPGTPPPAPQADPNLIRDFLGGAQLDAGKQAQEVLQDVNDSRQEDLEELGLE